VTDTVKLPRFGVIAALVADTFQEAMARWLFWGLFGLSTLLILFFLFILKIDVVEGAVSLLGLQKTSHSFADLRRIVHLAYSQVALFLYVLGHISRCFRVRGPPSERS